jgi:alpha-beta hydrolase superfamily lysophospholipase
MTPAFVVEITTPKKYVLNGLWFGPKKPKRLIIWVHGLGSSMFSKQAIFSQLADKRTAVLSFNNRGHDKIAAVPHASGSFSRTLKAGSAHERFTDCLDDIQGAINFVRRVGVKDIYLAGHSTGSQKSAYWALQKRKGVKGLILLSPMSDFSALRVGYPKAVIARALAHARIRIKKGRGHELLSQEIWDWPWLSDAKRFVSLYAGKGPEELFTYWDPDRKAMIGRINLPVLVLLPHNDEFADRPISKIAAWFESNLKRTDRVVIIPHAGHSLRGAEKATVSEIRRFMRG